MARYLYATAPDGTVVKRRTDNDYAYAICVRSRTGEDAWTAPSWSGSLANARKAANKFQGFGYRTHIADARTER